MVDAHRDATHEIARDREEFRVDTRKAALDGGDYTIDHTNVVYLVDGYGRSAASISFSEVPTSPRKLETFVREEAVARATSRTREEEERGDDPEPARQRDAYGTMIVSLDPL